MNIAIIPARGGSKRIPRKNIKPFLGKPMIAYSIEVALASGLFDKVIVSTDDAEIFQVAKEYGAEAPFMRPISLADDITGTVPVIAHAIQALRSLEWEISNVCCLYATAPFVLVEDLRIGLNLLQTNDADYTFSATSFPFPIQRAIKISESQKVGMFYPEYEQARSQDLPEAYHDAGQFYWGRAESFLAHKPIFTSNSYAVQLPRARVQDIDTLEDWESAEWLYKAMQNKERKV